VTGLASYRQGTLYDGQMAQGETPIPPQRSGLLAFFGERSLGRYGVLGLSGVAVDFAIYGLLVVLGLSPVPATIVSSFAGIMTNYGANALLNFRVGFRPRQAVRFLLVGAVGLVIGTVVVHFGVMIGLGAWWAKVASLAMIVPSQFLANRLWTFA
jgi:putative flippase GtrA